MKNRRNLSQTRSDRRSTLASLSQLALALALVPRLSYQSTFFRSGATDGVNNSRAIITPASRAYSADRIGGDTKSSLHDSRDRYRPRFPIRFQSRSRSRSYDSRSIPFTRIVSRKETNKTIRKRYEKQYDTAFRAVRRRALAVSLVISGTTSAAESLRVPLPVILVIALIRLGPCVSRRSARCRLWHASWEIASHSCKSSHRRGDAKKMEITTTRKKNHYGRT